MPLHIGLLVFPGIQPLDLAGPLDVFAALPGAVVHLVWKDRTPLLSATGLVLTPGVAFPACPPLDAICVPGDAGVDALLEDKETLAFVRHQAAGARYVASVCTGALVLGAAGLLRGKRATTHWSVLDLLEAFGAVPVRARVVRDGALITGGGVTAGIDFALTLAAELAGPAAAQAIQLLLEYAPAPPFEAGRPETAPPEVLRLAEAEAAPGAAARRRIVSRIGTGNQGPVT